MSSILRGIGFYFSGNLFSSTATSNHVLAAFVGPATDLKTAQQNVYRLTLALFNLLITYQHLILAFGVESEMVWKVVTEAWAVYTIIPIDEVKEIVSAFTLARRKYNKDPPIINSLTEIVDQWIRFLGQLPHSPPPAQLALPLRPLFPGPGNTPAFVNALQGMSLTSVPTNQPWPPQHLNQSDLAYLADTRVSQALEGITTTAPGTEQRAWPNRVASPIDVRIFICWVALISITADSDKALYMTPIGFLNGYERRDWYGYVGAQAKILGTLNSFLEYASSAMGTGKKMVAGLFAKWYCDHHLVTPLANVLDAEGEEIWRKHIMRRHGMGIVLRLIKHDPNAKPVLQLVLFDPFDFYDEVKKSFGGNQMGLMAYRGKIIGMVKDWAQNMEVSGVETWWGGVQAMSGEPDSMQRASMWVQQWVNGPTLPNDAARMQTLGFKRGLDL